jgi:hypothetical protein
VGEQAARQLREAQGNRGQRRKDARDALLRWIHEQTVATSLPPSMDGFIGSPMSRYYASLLSVDEIAQTSDWLMQRGFIRGTQRADGIVDVPIITPKGEQMVDSGRSVNEPEPPASGNITTYISQTGAYSTAQAAGHGTTQSVTCQITDDHRKQTLHLAEVIEHAQASLPDASEVVAELRAAVEEGQNDRGKLRAALESAKATVVTGMGQIVGKAMRAGFAGLLAHYGIPLT